MFKSVSKPFVLLGFSIVILLLLCSWSLRYDIFGGALHIDESVICMDLDENRQPLRKNANIVYGTKQVCLWFKYSKGYEGCHVKISWYYEEKLMWLEQQKLMSKEGVKAFYLLREDGSLLPAGNYKIVISTPTKILSEIPFAILNKNK